MSSHRIRMAVLAMALPMLAYPSIVREAGGPPPETPRPLPPATTEVKPPASQPCSNTSKPFVPTRLTMSSFHRGFPVMVVGAVDGAAGTPPTSELWTVAWFNGSSKPGSGKGHVVMTAHTWGSGYALGNMMQAGAAAGQRWIASDGAGHRICYTITKSTVVDVATWDEHSTLVYNTSGPETVVLVVCRSKNWRTGEWDQREVFTATRDDG